MLSKERIWETAIALTNLLLCALLNAFAYRPVSCLSYGRILQVTASGVLLFGALWAEPQHRLKIRPFWLMASVVYLGLMIYDCSEDRYSRPYTINSANAAVLLPSMLWIYRLHVGKDKEEAPTAIAPVQPPPYKENELVVRVV